MPWMFSLRRVAGLLGLSAVAVMAAAAVPGAAPADTGDGTTPLHWAVHDGDMARVTQLLKAGADPKAVNDYGATPLSEAAERGDATLIRVLLKAGADVESANPEGQTALMTVARTGSVEAAKVLLAAGAKVNAVEQWRGQTALMWASAQGHPDMVRLLLKAGAQVDARSAVRQWPRKVSAEPRPQNRPNGGFTALLLAAREGCTDCAKALVERGAAINLADPDNITPLLMAVLNARFDTAAYLIKAGADVNRWDTWGRAPLYSAVDYNTTPRGGRPDRPSGDATTALDVMRLLLDKGANPNMQLKLFPPYRSLGQDRGGDSMLTVGTTPLIRAAKAGDVEAVTLLLRYKAQADFPNSLGITPFMAAAGIGSTTIDIRARFRNEQRSIETAKLLRAAGANPNAVRDNGQAALHGAALWGWNEFVSYLAQVGAWLDLRDQAGATALDVAQGKAGGTGRAGVAGAEVHPDTAALLRKLGNAAGN
ncbi:MAG: ankyrin repeat domain-containing protein [Proteobacteria bacterium]|nr:ankyrin repeat domain-containing protein [Pseudomonadota bacterium]